MASGKRTVRKDAPQKRRGQVTAKLVQKAEEVGQRKVRGESHAATNARLRARIVALMVENPDMTVADIALELKISAQRVRAYMTGDVRREVEELRRKSHSDPTLEEIDLAMRRQARLGNVQAARLVYLRNAQQEGAVALPTLEELEAELLSLKKKERAKETNDDAGLDDTAAVADAARR